MWKLSLIARDTKLKLVFGRVGRKTGNVTNLISTLYLLEDSYIYYRWWFLVFSSFIYLYLVNTKAKGPHLRAFELINFYLIWLPFCLVASNNFLWNSSCFGFDITNNATAAIRGLITNAISNHVNQPLPLELASTPTSAANTIHKITIIIVHFPVVIKVNLKLYAYYNDCQEQLKIKMWRKATMCIFPIER